MKGTLDIDTLLTALLFCAPGTAVLTAAYIYRRRTRRTALASLQETVSHLGIIAGPGTVPAHGNRNCDVVLGELRGRPIAIELVAGGKSGPPSTIVSRRVARPVRTLGLPTSVLPNNFPWLSIAPKLPRKKTWMDLFVPSTFTCIVTGNEAFDAAYAACATIGMSLLSGPKYLEGHFSVSPALAPALARVPVDVWFYFDGEFVVARWQQWHLEQDRLVAVIAALDVMLGEVPSWVDQLARAGAAIR